MKPDMKYHIQTIFPEVDSSEIRYMLNDSN